MDKTENAMETEGLQGLHELKSKLLVCPLIAPIVLHYLIPYITPLKEFSLDYSSYREVKDWLHLKQQSFLATGSASKFRNGNS